jgi:hypothetical protein
LEEKPGDLKYFPLLAIVWPALLIAFWTWRFKLLFCTPDDCSTLLPWSCATYTPNRTITSNHRL